MDAFSMLCLMSRIDYDKISEDRKAEILPYYDAFQDAVNNLRLVSTSEGTTIEIMVRNSLVEETNKLLWYGIHDLVSPGNISYIEIHNFDEKGNTIDIEKYLVDGIVMSIIKDKAIPGCQMIKIIGSIDSEITFEDKAELRREE
jgi:hypothetical protein